ncbi:hypothetical protein OS242_05220 [Tumebacillus sp. DT12]|uniref:Uncharacterized protein n=1 Tax=Tumebacillus lacus TaxID=2995335 RepID=A0ABT3WXE9_9BACL|nr:hypothetical protein [Tumebacillus lacus]MCX7569353.1 hypothetical protein [Tumebacillus lacus]
MAVRVFETFLPVDEEVEVSERLQRLVDDLFAMRCERFGGDLV